MNLSLKGFLLKSSDPSFDMANCRKRKKFKNTLLNGTSIFQALNDIEKHRKVSFLNENVGFLFVDVLRTKEVDKSPMIFPHSLHVTSFCIQLSADQTEH